MVRRSRSDYDDYLRSPEWQERRQAAFRAYGTTCQVCGSSDNINVHHVTYVNFKVEPIEDLRVVCALHHDQIHRDRWAAKEIVRITRPYGQVQVQTDYVSPYKYSHSMPKTSRGYKLKEGSKFGGWWKAGQKKMDLSPKKTAIRKKRAKAAGQAGVDTVVLTRRKLLKGLNNFSFVSDEQMTLLSTSGGKGWLKRCIGREIPKENYQRYVAIYRDWLKTKPESGIATAKPLT